MIIHDATLPINESLPVWPGDLPVRLTVALQEGGVQVTHLSLSAHTGTHIDAPRHLLGPAAASIDDLDLDLLRGPATLYDLSACPRLDRAVLEQHLGHERPRRLLLRLRATPMTPESYLRYSALEADAARCLVACGVRLVGIDAPSVDAPDSCDLPIHHALLEAGVIIIENLALDGIAPGEWQCACLPIKLSGADGAPARVLLWC